MTPSILLIIKSIDDYPLFDVRFILSNGIRALTNLTIPLKFLFYFLN